MGLLYYLQDMKYGATAQRRKGAKGRILNTNSKAK
jgi:hypothetical protein